MDRKKHPFDLVKKSVAAAGSNDITTNPVKAGWLYCFQRIAVENETSAYTDLRILKSGVGGEILLEEEDSPQAATLYWTADPVFASEGDYLIARLTGCTASDVLKLHVLGWFQEVADA